MNCPNCNTSVETLYKRTSYAGNIDTDEYCSNCNPELAYEIEQDRKSLDEN